jgi:hypothetical protein
MDPAFDVLSSGGEATVCPVPSHASTHLKSSGQSSLNTNISGSSHDTSRVKYHITDISAFATDLNEAAKAAFPNRGRTRYDTVSVNLMPW